MHQISSRGAASGPPNPKMRPMVRMLEACLLLAPPIPFAQSAGLWGLQGMEEGSTWLSGIKVMTALN